MEVSKKVWLSEMAMLLVAMIWGGTFVAAQFAQETIPTFWILAIRFILAGLIMSLVFWKEWKKLDGKTIRYGATIGLLLFSGIGVQMVGLQFTTPAKQSFVLVSYVIIVPLMEWAFYKKKPAKKIFVSGVLCLIGVGLLSLNDQLRLSFGDACTLVYALVFSVQVLKVADYSPQVDSLILFSIFQFLTAGVLSLLLALITREVLVAETVSKTSFWGIVYLTIFNTALAFTIQNMAQKYARPANTALIMATESIFGALAAYFFAGEIFDLRKIIGCSLIFIAIFSAQFNPKALVAGKKGKKHDRQASTF